MPLTPFHFGPTGLLGLPFRRHLDLAVFFLANVVIDVEPLLLLVLPFNWPLHGFVHSYLIGGIAGGLWGWHAWRLRTYFERFQAFAKIPYQPNRRRMVVSGIAGAWTHVFVDSFMHADMRPFWPARGNPLLHLLTNREIYLVCVFCTILLALWYLRYFLRYAHKRRRRF